MKGILIILFSVIWIGALSDENPYNNNFRSANGANSFPLWKLTDIDGLLFIRGVNRSQDIYRGSFYDLQKSMIYSGGIKLNTKSFLWHPNFLKIELGGEFNPESNKNNYIILPDRAEVRTLNKFEAKGIFFSSKPITLITFFNTGDVYQNRENLNNIRTKMRTWGGSFSFRNKILPHNITYTNSVSDMDELNSERDYIYDNQTFEVRASRSFTRNNDRNELVYLKNDFNTIRYGTKNINKQNLFQLSNNYYLDKSKNINFKSIITNDDRKGTFNNLYRFRTYENLNYKLPWHIDFQGSFIYQKEKQDSIQIITNQYNFIARHQLYKSLNSGLFFDYQDIKYDFGSDKRTRGGVDIRYTKKVFPVDGRININYIYTRLNNNSNGNDALISVSREEHILTDGVIKLLNRAYINKSSLIITDITNTIIYQEGLDYLVIDRNNYLEIQRVPGGLILNNSTIYVNYTATQPGSYKYNSNQHALSMSMLFWKNLLEVYYRINYTGHTDLFQTEYVTLNYITQNIVGAKFNYEYVSGGVEYDNYKSTIVPYKMMRYFLDFNKSFNNRVTLYLNANMRDYNIMDNAVRNKLYDVQGKIYYRIVSNTTLNIHASYLKQDYNNIMLDLVLAGAELSTTYRKFNFILGVDFYHRKYLIEEYRLKGIYVQLTRKF